MPGASFPTPTSRNFTVINHKDEYAKLVERLKELLPNMTSDELKSLEEVMIYVISIIYGDDLHRFAVYNSNKKYLKDALDDLVSYVQNRIKEQEEADKVEEMIYDRMLDSYNESKKLELSKN